ncbi:hypothetical protein D9M71_155550 [compost metagenome]
MVMLGAVVVLRLQPLAVDPGDASLARRVVALQAEAVAWHLERRAVGIVAGAATQALGEHPALGEGCVLEHLLLDLAVQLVEFTGQRAGQVVVHQAVFLVVTIVQRRATGMAAGTGFHGPDPAGAAEVDGEAGVLRVELLRGPVEMAGSRAVAGLAADAEAVPAAGEAIGDGIVVTPEAGAVAFHAHEVGVLLRAAPVQGIAEVHALSGVEVEPGALVHIPGHAQGLQAAAADLDQVLLQRRDAEGVGHTEVGRLAVGAGGVDPEAAVLAEEAGGFAFALEADVIEVAQHAGVGGFLHRQLVVAAPPVIGLPGVAAGALAFVHHARDLAAGLGRNLARQGTAAALEVQPGAQSEQQQQSRQDRVDRVPDRLGRGILVVLRHADIRCTGKRASRACRFDECPGGRQGCMSIPLSDSG